MPLAVALYIASLFWTWKIYEARTEPSFAIVTSQPAASDLKTVVPFVSAVIALLALFVTMHDRRSRLQLRSRKGDWYKLNDSVDRRDLIFRGVVEVYNLSSRANAIREYEFWGKRESGDWERMESEMYGGREEESSNPTPFPLGPYSGAQAKVLAFAKMPRPKEMQVRIEVEDLFGKRYRVEVTATT